MARQYSGRQPQKKPIYFQLNPEQHEQYKAIAWAENRTLANLTERIVCEFLEKQAKKATKAREGK